MKRLLAALGALALVACSGSTGTDGGTGAGAGGAGGGNGLTPWAIYELDPAATETKYLAAAFDPVAERVGVAYYTPAGTMTTPGVPDYNLMYVEWRQGTASAPQLIRTMQRSVGLSVAFHPTTGEPYVAFLGGDPGYVVGQSIFWFQSDAAYATRSGSTWTETTVAMTGDQVTCGNPVSDRGFLVGVWPSILFDSTGTMYFAYRDGHDAQFGPQDWKGSDVEVWVGPPGATGMTGTCVNQGGNSKQGWGGHNMLAMGPGSQPVIVYDQELGGADTAGSNVFFQQRLADGSWTTPGQIFATSETQTGPSVAWDPTEGIGIAAIDGATSQLRYRNSGTGLVWSSPDEVFGTGSGGWYPSLAMDPLHHEPAIAFYVCSVRTGVAAQSCPAAEDELRVTQRVLGNWQQKVVDPEGGYSPRLAFFASGKRAIAYRHPFTGAVKLAVER